MIEDEIFDITAKTIYGLEEILAQEISAIGAEDIKILNRAVSFRGSKETLYRANLELRTALRILKPIYTFDAYNEIDLYRETKAFDWQKLISPSKTFAIESSVYSKYFNHENYVALKVKDAIVDCQREYFDRRSNIDVESPDVLLNVFVGDSKVVISLDSSGESLHKRGYRAAQGIAPINEVLAAGMILLSGWRGESDFVDPMCGSGTIIMEAATIANRIAPGILRDYFAFMSWDDFDENLWENVRNNSFSQQIESKIQIIGYDESQKAINISKENIKNAGLGWKAILKKKRLQEISREDLPDSGVVVINPPYGERMMDEAELFEFYGEIGNSLKANFDGFDVWIISSNRPALKKIGLRPSRKIILFNGALECRFQKYEMYKGTKRKKFLDRSNC